MNEHECGCVSKKGVYITKCMTAMEYTIDLDAWRPCTDDRPFKYYVNLLIAHLDNSPIKP